MPSRQGPRRLAGSDLAASRIDELEPLIPERPGRGSFRFRYLLPMAVEAQFTSALSPDAPAPAKRGDSAWCLRRHNGYRRRTRLAGRPRGATRSSETTLRLSRRRQVRPTIECGCWTPRSESSRSPDDPRSAAVGRGARNGGVRRSSQASTIQESATPASSRSRRLKPSRLCGNSRWSTSGRSTPDLVAESSMRSRSMRPMSRTRSGSTMVPAGWRCCCDPPMRCELRTRTDCPWTPVS